MMVRLAIPAMTTVHAMRAVETALILVPGIDRYELQRGTLTIVHGGTVTDASLRDAIATAGYQVSTIVSDTRRIL